MSITKDKTLELVKDFGGNDKNSGSAEVQVAILTTRIANLTEHMKINKKDNHSKMGLFKMVGLRKRLLTYIKNKDEGKYKELIAKLGLRK